MQYSSVVLIGLAILYVTIVTAFWVKLNYYGVKRFKLIVSVIGPIYIMVTSVDQAISYPDSFAKENGLKLNLTSRIAMTVSLLRLNIEWFPTLMGFFAFAMARAEKSLPNIEAQRRQAERTFQVKSYKLYDDLRAPMAA